ncbi:type VII secretion system-associated protein [Streptomyces sp. NBC_01373]|uniref:type VII secretion system-associated protein n=1 Tax=unclassified Streptomyces TaxID=2593676 RepID=UPI00225013AB|nr:type VII secretion system-associated protein [Streptomyces sp. NBC_01373]MCX4703074.1 type VII secretion system-associated protein [Streptomyces sp. NBC_01373]
MAKVTVLDSAFLKQFITDQIEAFAEGLERMGNDDPNAGPAIKDIAEIAPVNTTINATKPLIIGGMAGQDSPVGGAALNTVIQKAADEISRILEDQTVLFEDLQAALWETIEELNKNQGKSLQDITADEFMDVFEDVDSSLTGEGDDEEETA